MGENDVHITRVPPSLCPNCGVVMDVVSALLAEDKKRAPEPNDVTLCFRCGEWLWFDKELHVRQFTDDDLVNKMAENIRHALTMVRRGLFHQREAREGDGTFDTWPDLTLRGERLDGVVIIRYSRNGTIAFACGCRLQPSGRVLLIIGCSAKGTCPVIKYLYHHAEHRGKPFYVVDDTDEKLN